MKTVKFLQSWNLYTVGETAGFENELANNLIKEGIAEEWQDKSGRKRLADAVPDRPGNVDWIQVQSFTKQQTGKEPKTKQEAIELLQLDQPDE